MYGRLSLTLSGTQQQVQSLLGLGSLLSERVLARGYEALDFIPSIANNNPPGIQVHFGQEMHPGDT